MLGAPDRSTSKRAHSSARGVARKYRMILPLFTSFPAPLVTTSGGGWKNMSTKESTVFSDRATVGSSVMFGWRAGGRRTAGPEGERGGAVMIALRDPHTDPRIVGRGESPLQQRRTIAFLHSSVIARVPVGPLARWASRGVLPGVEGAIMCTPVPKTTLQEALFDARHKSTKHGKPTYGPFMTSPSREGGKHGISPLHGSSFSSAYMTPTRSLPPSPPTSARGTVGKNKLGEVTATDNTTRYMTEDSCYSYPHPLLPPLFSLFVSRLPSSPQ